MSRYVPAWLYLGPFWHHWHPQPPCGMLYSRSAVWIQLDTNQRLAMLSRIRTNFHLMPLFVHKCSQIIDIQVWFRSQSQPGDQYSWSWF